MADPTSSLAPRDARGVTARYAIYYAPEPNHPLTNAAAEWLGRDAFGRVVEPQARNPSVGDVDRVELTADPRHYGFHATLKAPFTLATEKTEQELVKALTDFAAARTMFVAPLVVADLGPFVALRLASVSPEMDRLHQDCVQYFEVFRAPLDEADLVRRRRARLTPLQDERLVAFGYPYIFDDFRFHMTLTGGIPDNALRSRVIGYLKETFAPWEGDHTIDRISIFKQEDRKSPFLVLAQAEFSAV